ncbi:unnamed protein product [Urochloa decumbens]|uniref:Phytocyanin domain-containing protein n=1 Tax=Urochloa decumbens TaxID=240449 RepID=A0ABC9CN01_9POAL
MAAAATSTSRRLLTLAAGVFFLAVCLLQAAEGTRYTVGGADGWRVPPPEAKDRYYSDWASNFTFYVDDSIEFVYKNDSAVIRVSKAGYYHCNESTPDAPPPPPPRDGTTLFVLDAPGPAYFASADQARCAMGERLMLDVLAAAAAAPGPWAPSPGPSAQHHHSAAATAAPSSVVILALAAAGRFV